MTVKELEKAITTEAKRVNARILEAERLEHTTQGQLDLVTAKQMKNPFVSRGTKTRLRTSPVQPKGRGRKEALQAQLRMIRRTEAAVPTPGQIKANWKRISQKYGISIEAAKQLEKNNTVFNVMLQKYSIFDSNQVQERIENFDKTPTERQLEKDLFKNYGRDLMGTKEGELALYQYLNAHPHETIPGLIIKRDRMSHNVQKITLRNNPDGDYTGQ